MPSYEVDQAVTHNGRPAIIITRPAENVTGGVCYGVRYTDVEGFEDDPRMPGLRRPVHGSTAIAYARDLA